MKWEKTTFKPFKINMILSHGGFSQWLLLYVVSLQPQLHANEIRTKMNSAHTNYSLFICVLFFRVLLAVIKAKLSEFRIATGEIMFAVYGGTNLSEMQIATKSFVC